MVVLIFLSSVMAGPACSAVENVSDKTLCDIELEKKCPNIALLYVCGDKISAQRLANETLPSVEKKYKELHATTNANKIYDYASELDMLKAVIGDDGKSVEKYMNKDFHLSDVFFQGIKFGLNEQLQVYERSLSLIAAEPLNGPSSYAYLIQGEPVAAMLYESGQIDRAKPLARELLLLQSAESKKNTSRCGHSLFKLNYERQEAMLNGILNNDNEAVAKYMVRQACIEDSIGARLEEAYGRIYLYKKLHKDLPLENRLAYAYKYLGWVQAVAGNYDESERAYHTALELAQEKYGRDYPEIPLEVRSEYSGMLRVAGKTAEADKMAEGLTRNYLNKVAAKAHPEQSSQIFTGAPLVGVHRPCNTFYLRDQYNTVPKLLSCSP